MIEIVSLPHQYAPGYYSFGLTQDGTAVFIPLLSLHPGQMDTWKVSSDAIERAVSLLMAAGFSEVDSLGVTIGNDMLVLGVKLDARRIAGARPASRKERSADSLCDAMAELKEVLGIDAALRRAEEEWRAPASRQAGNGSVRH